jgi:hypothetical protein
MKKVRKKLFIAIMICFGIVIFLIAAGILFILDGDSSMGVLWIAVAMTGFFINLQSLKENRKRKKNGKLRFK